MNQTNTVVTFTCPGCLENFTFDDVGEYELVSCPICRTHFMTVRKDNTLLLEPFSPNLQNTEQPPIIA
jgi:hypothetical protein